MIGEQHAQGAGDKVLLLDAASCKIMHICTASAVEKLDRHGLSMSSHDTCRALAPLLLLMKGHPGSGKSTLARLIASNFGIAISDKDDSRDCFQAAEEEFGSAGAWDLNELSYQVMFRVASSQLHCGQSVVVDCPLSKVELYQQANSIAEQVSLEIFSCILTLLIVCTTD